MITKPQIGTAINRAHPFAPFLTACWLFNEYSGDTVLNVSNNRNNGALHSAAVWGGDGVDFAADYAHVDCGNAANILGPAGTILFIFRATTTPLNYRYFVNLATDIVEFGFYQSVTNVLTFNINGSEVMSSPLSDIGDGAQHVVIFSWDADLNSKKVFFDGKYITGSSASFTWDATGVAAHNFILGGRTNATGRYSGGIISHMAVLSKQLSDADVSAWSTFPYQIYDLGSINHSILSVDGGYGVLPIYNTFIFSQSAQGDQL